MFPAPAASARRGAETGPDAEARTSFVFVCLIYSLVLVIGDVGKAVVVVVMIVQIAVSFHVQGRHIHPRGQHALDRQITELQRG